MIILPLDPVQNASPAALRDFFVQCQAAAVKDARPKLVSISLQVDALDPLAVLESIFEPGEPHFYAERPDIDSAIAGAESAVRFTAQGPGRFAAAQTWMDAMLADTIAVGDVNAPFGGPHFFTAFSFFDEVESGEPFPAAQVFVPRWQVARAGTVTTAVANVLIAPEAALDPLVERVWRAHAKFKRFEYGSGTGVPPVSAHGQDAHATIVNKTHGRDARATSIQIRQGAYLPHWTRDGAIYAVTFRLADSLPANVVESWRLEREAILRQKSEGIRPLTAWEDERLSKLHAQKIEALLDAGQGACHLRQPEIAALVAEALQHFDGMRYELHEWCVMPNHVHVVLRPLGNHDLAGIVHSWKSYTAKEANRQLGRDGEFWQPEYYDHLIRDAADYAHATDYVRSNPQKAGLMGWRWQGRGTGVPPVSAHGQDAHATIVKQTHGRDARATFQVKETGDYRAVIARALERIAAGEFSKIVLARVQEVVASAPLHPLRMLNGLRQRFPDCYAFSLANGAGQSFIGASPERLVRVSKGVLETEALAGTTRRGGGASEDAALAEALLRSDKDRREHELVVEAVVGRLRRLGLDPASAPTPGLRRLANLQHLHTPVRAEMKAAVRLLDVLAALHPTPAVGGTPQEAAVARIRELEGFPRGLYAGALGWMNARGGGEFFVGLRSALVISERALVYAGAGIVAGSTPEKEFAETELKFKAMLDALSVP